MPARCHHYCHLDDKWIEALLCTIRVVSSIKWIFCTFNRWSHIHSKRWYKCFPQWSDNYWEKKVLDTYIPFTNINEKSFKISKLLVSTLHSNKLTHKFTFSKAREILNKLIQTLQNLMTRRDIQSLILIGGQWVHT